MLKRLYLMYLEMDSVRLIIETVGIFIFIFGMNNQHCLVELFVKEFVQENTVTLPISAVKH